MVQIGSSPDDRYVILHADDFGMCHATNQAIIQMLNEKAISSTTLMVNCPWSTEAAAAAVRNPGFDVGIHLTLTSEWDSYKWGPVGRKGNVDTLVNEFGLFPAEVGPVAQADPEQVRAEVFAQMETALRMGIDPTHVDNHMGACHFFMDIYLEVAAAYRLPFRFMEQPWGPVDDKGVKQIAELAKQQGVLYPDEVIALPFWYEQGEGYEDAKRNAIAVLKGLKPGVTEVLFHPSLDTDELKGITDTWPFRRYEYDLFRDPDIQAAIRSEGLKVIGWRELRDIQRG
jgi:predicted glycoside hydrolase/deacetylase ChbG (UPF0249 family)